MFYLYTPTSIELIEALSKDKLYKNLLGLKDISQLGGTNIQYSYYLYKNKENIPVGVIIVHLLSAINVCFHAGLYKEYRGNFHFYFNEGLKLLKEKAPLCTFSTFIPESNIPAIKAIAKTHFVNTGYLPGPIKILIYSES